MDAKKVSDEDILERLDTREWLASEMERRVSGITKQKLASRLKRLAADGLVVIDQVQSSRGKMASTYRRAA